MDRIYLLSLEQLFDVGQSGTDGVMQPQEQLLEMATARLDSERKKRLEQVKHGKKRLESLGAGLLLQLAVQEAVATEAVASGNPVREVGEESIQVQDDNRIISLTFSQLLEKLQEPLPLEYTYGDRGKPYLKNFPFYFNISHSGNYVLCVISRQEVGADIQLEARVNEKVVQRFFTAEERAYWEQCGSEERRDFFYRLWCCKEAYGKLTGQGISSALNVNMSFIRQDGEGRDGTTGQAFLIQEYEAPDKYRIAVCKWK